MRRTVAGAPLVIDHRHANIECDLVIRGSGSVTLEERSYELKPGTLIWLAPRHRHRLIRSPSLEMWVMSFRANVMRTAHLAELAAQPLKQLTGDELMDLDRLLSQVAQDSDEPVVYNAGITYLAMRVWRASRDSAPAHVRPLHPAVARALLLLRQSGAVSSLSDIAKAAGVTAPYLSRLLVEHTGRSFLDWRNRVRIDQFMHAYRPGVNLLNAALDAGFGSYTRFHHVFTELMGCSPSDWAQHVEHQGMALDESPKAQLPADYGVPAAAILNTRHHWTSLVRVVAPAVGDLLGKAFLERVLAAPPGDPGEGSSHDRLDASLPSVERDRLISSLRAQNPAAAEKLGQLIDVHDFTGTYASVLGAFGASVSRLSDAVTALLLVLWTAANRGTGPGVAEANAVRRQVRSALGRKPSRLPPRAVQDAHTALLCHFVVTYRALEATRASGDLRAFDDLSEAACDCSRTAFDGDVVKITFASYGLVRRESGSNAGLPRRRRSARVKVAAGSR